MRIDARSDRPIPLTLERGLTAVIQGRNAIEKARREVADAIEIFSRLSEELPGKPSGADEWLLRLGRLLEQLDASHGQLQGLDTIGEPPVPVTAVAGRR